jgi:Glycosyltransferase
MKKVVLHVNSFLVGSTGNIMRAIATTAENYNFKSFVAYPSSRTNNKVKLKNSIKIGNIVDRNIHLSRSYLSGYDGRYSVSVTRRFLKYVDKIRPDIIHLHNLHNCYINIELLFEYIKKNNISIIWTLHDCWSFTGHCPHYKAVNCNKWQTECFECPQYKQYPASRTDKSKEMYKLKKSWFTDVEKMIIVTPSDWLKGQVKKSFLSEYQVEVINNGIDLSVFKPTVSNFRDKNDLYDKKIILGVASPWSEKKGLNIFIKLSEMLGESYKIVLVGLTDIQISKLPEDILGLPKTNNQIELAEIYSAADIFLNPTYEDTFPTTNLEAMACGTPIVTFNTGGSVEVINEYTGRVVENNNLSNLRKEIETLMIEGKNTYFNERLNNATKYINKNKYKEYIDLYLSMFM